MSEFWPDASHWSLEIPLHTPHPRLPILEETGAVVLRPTADPPGPAEWLELEYMDWKSGGDTRFGPIATATGELDCQGFWSQGDERPDKDALLTTNAQRCPTLVKWVESVGANYGRCRVIELAPQGREQALRSFHRDDNNRFNPDDEGWVVRVFLQLTDDPDSYMLLMDPGPDGLPDPATEQRIPLTRGTQIVADTQRLWHVVVHNGTARRYGLITSFESGPALDAWVESQLP